MIPARDYLFVTWEGGGNVPPVLGLAGRLAARGHRVRVLSEPCHEEAVERAGARFIPFTRHFVRRDRAGDLIGDARARTPLDALRRTFHNVVFGPARIVAEETRAALLAEPTDVVAADLMLPGALVAAEAEGITRVVLFHTPEYLPGPGRPAAGPGFLPRADVFGRIRDRVMTGIFHRQLVPHLPAYNAARRAVGLPPLGSPRELMDEFHRAELRLIQTTRAFDFPIDPAPANVRYVGPVLDDPDWAAAWRAPWDAGDRRPLVVVSLSSTFQDQSATLRRIVAALGSLEVRGVVTLGPAMADEALDPPSNVLVTRSASHAQLFPRAAAVVTHAGHGTVMRALANDLPLVCLPMGRDQDDNAARVVAHGAGVRLRRSASSARIAAAVRRVLEEPGFAAGAARLGAEIRADVAEDRGVRELERVGRKPVAVHA
jgi:UDP:flavonoid glycosyltransferase YjiC (YdhE family)